MQEENRKPQDQNSPTNNAPLKKGDRRNLGVVILNILLALLTIALLGYIAYRNGYIDLDNILETRDQQSQEEENEEQEEELQEEEVETEQQEENDEEPVTLETYEGEYFSAIHPTDWEIIEYYDGEGTTMMSGGTTYTGLTGIQINKDGEEIMKLEGVSGIGFVGCPELPQWEDSSPTYEQEQEDISDEIGGSIDYLDYTDVPYSEFEWLGKRIRRVGAALYYDTVAGEEYFEPQCEVSFLRIEDFGFEDSAGFEGDTYMYTVSQDTTEQELTMLDQILISMMAN